MTIRTHNTKRVCKIQTGFFSVINFLYILKDADGQVYWSDMVVACKNNIIQEYDSTTPIRALKSRWKKRIEGVAKELHVTIKVAIDSWHVIKNMANVNVL